MPQKATLFPHVMPLSDFIAKHTTEAQCEKVLERSHWHNAHGFAGGILALR